VWRAPADAVLGPDDSIATAHTELDLDSASLADIRRRYDDLQRVTEKGDVYSVAMTGISILGGETPFQHLSLDGFNLCKDLEQRLFMVSGWTWPAYLVAPA
jgi:hypothetical protein